MISASFRGLMGRSAGNDSGRSGMKGRPRSNARPSTATPLRHSRRRRLAPARNVNSRARSRVIGPAPSQLRRADETRPSCGASAACRFAADREQRGAALGAAALPAGTTVGQGHLPRVGDGDLLAADAPGLRAGILCLRVPRAPLNHARPPYSWWKAPRPKRLRRSGTDAEPPASSYARGRRASFLLWPTSSRA